MHPEIVHIPLLDESLPSYFTLLVLGFSVATWSGARAVRRWGLDREVVIDLGLFSLIAGVIGARILHVLADGYFWDYVNLCVDHTKVVWHVSRARCLSPGFGGVWDAARAQCHPAEGDCFAWAAFWRGGLTYYGGFVAASAYAIYFLRKERFPILKACDMAGVAVPLGLFFGRLGCFLGGCCFGIESHASIAVSFPGGSPASEAQFRAGRLASEAMPSLAVLPAQLFESLSCLAIAAACMFAVTPRKRFDGQVFLSFVILYALARFGLEYLRSDDRGGLWGFSTSQLIGIVSVAVAAGLWVSLARLARSRLATPADAPKTVG